VVDVTSDATSPFAGKVWLAPLTLGGNLPFRRLCVEQGAEVTVSEMVVVRKLLKDHQPELIAASFLENLPTKEEPGSEIRGMLGPKLGGQLKRV